MSRVVAAICDRLAPLLIDRLRLDLDDTTRCFSIAEVAERTTLSERSVREMTGTGRIPSLMVGGRRVVRAIDLRRFLDEQRAIEEARQGAAA